MSDSRYGALREKFVAEHSLKSELERIGVSLIGKEGGKRMARCPFHDDKNPSFSVNLEEGVWNCFAGCGSGGVVELVARHEGKTEEYILDQYGKSLDINSKNGHSEPVKILPPLDWSSCVEAFGDAHKKRLCEWRGYSRKFVDELVERRMVGICEGNLAFPIYAGGKVVGTHQKLRNGWITRGKQYPWVIGDHFENVLIFESQWDAFALMDQGNWFGENSASAVCSIVITRGAANGKSVQNLFPTRGKIICWMQNDKPDDRGNIPAEKWLTDILSVVPKVHVCRPPTDYKDVNDWVSLGLATRDDLINVMESATPHRDPNRPEIKPALDLTLAMRFDPKNDTDCLMGNRYLCKGGSSIWVGGSGIGKSVMTLQAAITFALNEDLFGLKPKRALRSVVMTAEDDFGDISETVQGVLRGMGIEPGSRQFDVVKENVLIYQEARLKGLEAIGFFEELVVENKADLIWINPLLSYYTGNPSDPEKSAEFTGGLTNMQVKTGVCTNLIHHTGKPAEAKARDGWSIDDYSYVGLGSSVWTNWARAIVAIQGLKKPKGTFVMRFAKRGQRAGIINDEFQKVREIYIEHGEVGLAWMPSEFCPEEEENTGVGRPSKCSWSKVNDGWDGGGQNSIELKKIFRGILSISDKTASRILSEWSGVHIRKNSEDLWVKMNP